jgi:hypothetical protein
LITFESSSLMLAHPWIAAYLPSFSSPEYHRFLGTKLQNFPCSSVFVQDVNLIVLLDLWSLQFSNTFFPLHLDISDFRKSFMHTYVFSSRLFHKCIRFWKKDS